MEPDEELELRLEVTLGIARRSEDVLLGKKSKINPMYKTDNFDVGSIATEADFASEELILKWLNSEFPEDSIYSEEKGWQKKEGAKYTWCIDPLDGTSNYARGSPLYGLSIGLEKEGQAVLGILCFPELGNMNILYALKGKGAFKSVSQDLDENEKLSVSNRPLKQALYYGGGYYRGRFGTIQNVAERMAMLKIDSSSAHDLAQIALGNAELYIMPNVPHDIVAGVCIVREAGGKVTDFEGKEWNINSKGIVVSNGIIHDEVIGILSDSKDQLNKAFGGL